MRQLSSPRRRVLLAVASLAAVGNIIFLSAWSGTDAYDFQVKWANISTEFLDTRTDGIPLFDSATKSWSDAGDIIHDLEPYLEETDPLDEGDHGNEIFITVQLAEGASVNTYRQALSSLAALGICRVAVVNFQTPVVRFPLGPGPNQERFIEYQNLSIGHQVMTVRSDEGDLMACEDRYNLWPPN